MKSRCPRELTSILHSHRLATAFQSASVLAAAWMAAPSSGAAAIAPLTASAPMPAQAPQLILRYRFDDAADPTANSGALGSSQDGDISGGSWQFVAAGSGQALSFASTTYVEPNGPENAFDIADQDFSAYARVQCGSANITQERPIVVKRDNNGTGFSLSVAGGSGHATFTVGGNQSASVQGTSSLDDLAWHDVLGVRHGNTLSIYVDGSLQAQAPALNLGSTANSKALRVGRLTGGPGGGIGFSGRIDEVGIYAEAVTPVIVFGGTDCNQNGLDDALEIANGTGPDCNGNGVLDSCDGGSVGGDCNVNGLCDTQEIAQGLAPDVNHNGVPDDCEPWNYLPYEIDFMWVFGDSLSDIGNLFAQSGNQHPSSPPNFQGRFSNGRVWCEYLAGYLGLDSNHVRNFAFGGAATGDTNSLDAHYPGLPGLADEVEMYRQWVLAGHAPSPRSLFVVWIGPNDFNAFQQAGANIQLNDVVHAAMQNIEHALRDLAQLGAHKILVPNMPDLGATPVVRWNPNSELAAKARVATIGFNANLGLLLARLEGELGVDFVLFDAFRFYDEIVAHPTDFGFSDVLNPCLDEFTHTTCFDASSHLFWDELHPTTAAHRLLGLRAQGAVFSGGAALPSLPCADCPRAEICIRTPLNGSFTLEDSVLIRGHSNQMNRRACVLDINGIAVPVSSDGEFSTVIQLDPSKPEQPILATLTSSGEVLDRERVVVFRGPSITSSDTLDDAVVAQLSTSGIGALTDEIEGQLLAQHILDVFHWVPTPLVYDFSGDVQYVANVTNAGFGCSSVDIVPLNDRVFVQINLHDFFVSGRFDGWLSGTWDPGLHCEATLMCSRIWVSAEFRLTPGSGSTPVNVTQVGIIHWNMDNFAYQFDCDNPVGELVEAALEMAVDVQEIVRDALTNGVAGANGDLDHLLEDALGGVKLTNLGGQVGLDIDAGITDVSIRPDSARVDLSGRIRPLQGASGATYAVPYTALPQSSTNPATGQPSELKVSVAVQALNQLLLALWPDFQSGAVLHALELGAGPQSLTADVLSALVPAFDVLGGATPMEIRVRPTVPPMLLGQDGTGATLSNLYAGQVMVDFVPSAGAFGGVSVLSLAFDLRGSVDLDVDPTNAGLRASPHLSQNGLQGIVVSNALGADEASLTLLLDGVGGAFVSALDDLSRSIRIPRLSGLSFAPTHIHPEQGYVTIIVDIDSSYSRPDLIVESIDAPEDFDILNPHATVRIKNVGTLTALHGAWLDGALSLDNVYLNGNDIDMSFGGSPQFFADFGTGLAPGTSRTFTLNMNAVPNAVQSDQTLFVLVDPPFLFGGTGAFCERSEGNNLLGVGVNATVADASIASVTAPTNAIGGDGGHVYRVRVERNGVGLQNLAVPVRVAIGNPAIFWVDVVVNVPLGSSVDYDVWLQTPASFGTAGQSNTFPVTACANLAFDSNWSNNCDSTTVSVAAPWWNLRFDIVNAPASATHCYSTGWDVKVTNVGNVNSMNVCAITGIVLGSGSHNWSSNLGIANFSTPNLAPGASWTYHVNNYFVNCNAFQTTQYIKAEVNYSAGCFDNYAAGNFDQQAIQIH